jgi:TetR/AcrR family transcriptional regulator, regulator of autoinduction and epiphytic fitness
VLDDATAKLSGGRSALAEHGGGAGVTAGHMAVTEDTEPADGRAARSHRTRQAIISAMRALHAEGDLRPTAPRIAERAGVSLRTVWQQFADKEELLVEAVRRDRDILRSLVARIDPEEPLADRVELFTSQRAKVLEEMTPTWRAARLDEPFSEELRQERKRKTTGGRAELESVFAAELAALPGRQRGELADALHAVSIWSYWETLRSDLGLSPLRAQAVLRATFAALLARAGFRPE